MFLDSFGKNETVIAARFARDCMKKMKETVLKLEVSLGPDTADLDLRIGMHRYVLHATQ